MKILGGFLRRFVRRLSCFPRAARLSPCRFGFGFPRAPDGRGDSRRHALQPGLFARARLARAEEGKIWTFHEVQVFWAAEEKLLMARSRLYLLLGERFQSAGKPEKKTRTRLLRVSFLKAC